MSRAWVSMLTHALTSEAANISQPTAPETRSSELRNHLDEGDLHAKRVLSLANATLGVLASASLAIQRWGWLGPGHGHVDQAWCDRWIGSWIEGLMSGLSSPIGRRTLLVLARK